MYETPQVLKAINLALEEELGPYGNLSLEFLPEKRITSFIRAERKGVMAGEIIPNLICKVTHRNWDIFPIVHDSESFLAGERLIRIEGPLKEILQFENVLLNYLQKMSAIATFTSLIVKNLAESSLSPTHRAIAPPNFHIFERWAVSCGGGIAGKMGNSDSIIINEKNFTNAKNTATFLQKIKNAASFHKKLILETGSISFLKRFLEYKLDGIILKNITLAELPQLCAWIRENMDIPVMIEGNYTLSQLPELKNIAGDFLSLDSFSPEFSTIPMSLQLE
ncbi:hypothetical protein ACFL35_12350 [Candidatus Riflebacteria bacterium]